MSSDETNTLPELLKYVKYSSEEILRTPSAKKNNLTPLENKVPLRDILDKMFEPIFITNPETEENEKYTVCIEETSRYELQNLEEKVNELLKVRKARKEGICPIREDIYMQLFDEIIRQTTINCVERGQLLLRVRDHLQMTLAAYKTLHQGSVVFGTRKHLQATLGMPELEKKIQDLDDERLILDNKKIQLENELESIQKSFSELKAFEEEKRAKEIAFLKLQSKNLEAFLKSVKKSNSNN